MKWILHISLPVGTYRMALLGCSFCGYEYNSIHPIGTHFPGECPECYKMSCYVISEMWS